MKKKNASTGFPQTDSSKKTVFYGKYMHQSMFRNWENSSSSSHPKIF